MLAAIITICGVINAQAETLRGTVKDAVTGEALIGATVKILEADNAAAVTDVEGNFKLSLNQGGRYTVEATDSSVV